MSDVRAILVALACREGGERLRQMLSGTEWTLCFAPNFSDVEAALRASSFGAVICEGHFTDGHCWKDVLIEIQRRPIPPQLIVADRLADEALWAEVLDLGCYDLLITPFAAGEVLRVVPMAWDFWKRELERATASPKRPMPAEAGRQSFKRGRAVGAD
jgi:DNA-binding NtrC family response regulator